MPQTPGEKGWKVRGLKTPARVAHVPKQIAPLPVLREEGRKAG